MRVKEGKLEEVIERIKKFLNDQGVEIEDIDVSEPDYEDDGYLIRVYTNLKSFKKSWKLSQEVQKIVPEEDYAVLIYPKED